MHGLLTASGRMVHPMMVAPALAASTAPVLANHAAAGAAFFNNMRTPAALLAAGALKDAFVLQGRDQGSHFILGREAVAVAVNMSLFT